MPSCCARRRRWATRSRSSPGREEARLIYAGVAHMQPSDEPRLVIDIGGRSTEMIRGRGRTPQDGGVLPRRLRQPVDALLRGWPASRATASAPRRWPPGAEFEEGLQSFAPELWGQALGSSGTAGAVSQLLQASGVTDGRITPAGLRWCMARCLEAGHVDRIDLPGLKPERRAVLPGGLAILYTLSAHFDIRALWPAKGALRQGVIVDLHERLLALHRAAARRHARHLGGRPAAALRRRHRAGGARGRGGAGAVRQRGARPGPRDAPRTGLGLRAARGGPDGLAPRPPPPQRLPAGQRRRAGFLAEPAAPHRRPGAGPARRPAQDGAATGQRDLRLAGAVPAAGGHQVPRTRARPTRRRCACAPRGRDAVLAHSAAWAEANPRTLFLLQEEAATWARNGPLRVVLAVV